MEEEEGWRRKRGGGGRGVEEEKGRRRYEVEARGGWRREKMLEERETRPAD